MHTIHLICTWQRENEKKQRLSLVFTMAEYCVVKWWDGNILRTPRIIMSLTRAERINVDQWWPALPGGAAVVFRRSGGEGDPCGEIPALLVLILTLLGGDGSELGSSPPAPPAQNQHCSLSPVKTETHRVVALQSWLCPSPVTSLLSQWHALRKLFLKLSERKA